MSYAILQTGTTPPQDDQLQNVFAQLPDLTSLDAALMTKDACGVLLRGLDEPTAQTMLAALVAEGVSCEIADESVLMELPPPVQLGKAAFMDHALTIDNMVGHILELPWSDIALIAAGRVRLAEFKDHSREQISGMANDDFAPQMASNAESMEEQQDRWLLEIITANAALRYHLVAEKEESLRFFHCLEDRLAKEPAVNLMLAVRDMADRAPQAILNHGAYQLTQAEPAEFYYPTQTAFHREITWLLWMASSGRLDA